MRYVATAFFVLTSMGCLTIQSRDLEPRSAVLLSYAPESMVKPCSRMPPPPIDSYWTPSEAEIAEMESHFDRLLRLKSSGCCFIGWRIESLADYDLHYVGVFSRNRRLILIATANNWCDGGTGAWGVVYDTANHRFRDLRVNGVA